MSSGDVMTHWKPWNGDGMIAALANRDGIAVTAEYPLLRRIEMTRRGHSLVTP
jgi:hypothetical protein